MHRIITAIVLTLATAVAHGDMAEAACEVFQNGEKKVEASGPCQFSQRQGYIGLALKNGHRHDLSPGDEGNYTDENGHAVKRPVSETGKVFEWQNLRIVLTW